jgi:hypothetical protein
LWWTPLWFSWVLVALVGARALKNKVTFSKRGIMIAIAKGIFNVVNDNDIIEFEIETKSPLCLLIETEPTYLYFDYSGIPTADLKLLLA